MRKSRKQLSPKVADPPGATAATPAAASPWPAPRFDDLAGELQATVDEACMLLGAERSALTVLVRTSQADGKSFHNGNFTWPETGLVTAPDWTPRAKCGGGLHGYVMGEGDQSQLSADETARWQLILARLDECVTGGEAKESEPLGTKAKVKRAVVLYSGDRPGATTLLLSLGADPTHVPGGTTGATGDYGAASATGTKGAASATGDYGAASATGTKGAASATGTKGAASATGYQGAASATGDYGAASAVGKSSCCACLGIGQQGRVGENGSLILSWWDQKADRLRHVVKYAGEDGIEVGEWYSVDDAGQVSKSSKPWDWPFPETTEQAESQPAGAATGAPA